jgi:acyl phosphate:glycerol-3-phosphate acyltransferase
MLITILNALAVLALSFVIGSIPSGLLVVRIANGKDVRTVASGRTGTTNAMRAAGFLAGLVTLILDVSKGIATLWLVQWIYPGSAWMQVFAAILAILGHNYSIFLATRDEKGRLHFSGGAGGATAFGGAIALYPHIFLFILPLCVFVFLFIGYASVTTMTIPIIATIVFIYRAISGEASWIYVVYGILAELVIIWALRPNIQRLRMGTERIVGLRAYLQSKIK